MSSLHEDLPDYFPYRNKKDKLENEASLFLSKSDIIEIMVKFHKHMIKKELPKIMEMVAKHVADISVSGPSINKESILSQEQEILKYFGYE